MEGHGSSTWESGEHVVFSEKALQNGFSLVAFDSHQRSGQKQWDVPQQNRVQLTDDELAEFVNSFVELMRRDPNAGTYKMTNYCRGFCL